MTVALTILVVDDDRTTLQLARAALNGGGYRVLEALNGREALQTYDRLAANRLAPALVVTDLDMPEMGGVELIGQLRRAHGQVKIVVMTGIISIPPLPSDVGVLPKPFGPHDLLAAVQAALPRW